jgi:hypothetical protein
LFDEQIPGGVQDCTDQQQDDGKDGHNAGECTTDRMFELEIPLGVDMAFSQSCDLPFWSANPREFPLIF